MSSNPSRPAPDHGRWFEPIAATLGRNYLRYSFTKGTAQEVAFLADALGLRPGVRLLDAGCGPGRHARALADLGVRVCGVDISGDFLRLARDASPPGAEFVRADVRQLPFRAAFDRAICLCQGGFGLLRGDDGSALAAIAAALRPGGKVVLSAFSFDHATAHPPDRAVLDQATGVLHEHTSVRGEDGADHDVELWTTCFTAASLTRALGAAGLEVVEVWSVDPGDYARRPLDERGRSELLALARRPG